MKRLKINFLPVRQASVWMVVMCTVLIAVLLGEVAWLRSGEEDLQIRRDQLSAARRERMEAGSRVPESPVAKAAPYEPDARRALKEAAFSTAQAFVAIEHVAMVGVTPTSIELQADSGLVRLELEYADQSTLLKYLAALNEGEEKPRWQLLRAANKSGQQSGGLATMESVW